MSPAQELDLRFDELTKTPETVEALLKMLAVLEGASLDPEDWPKVLALGIAAWEYPKVREILAEPMPTEGPDVLDVEQLKHRQDVCLDPPGEPI